MTSYGKLEFDIGDEVIIKSTGGKGLVTGYSIKRHSLDKTFIRFFDVSYKYGQIEVSIYGTSIVEYHGPKYYSTSITADGLEPAPKQQTFWEEKW